MQELIYDVAVSVDGFIAGENGDIAGFAQSGPVVDDYFARLAGYATALMGRATYEFGYRFGLEPGASPYPHMQVVVASSSLDLPEGTKVTVSREAVTALVPALKRAAQGPVYLVGGGGFAGACLRAGLIDRLRLKRAPILLGRGTPLFDRMARSPDMRLSESRDYGGGYLFQEFELHS